MLTEFNVVARLGHHGNLASAHFEVDLTWIPIIPHEATYGGFPVEVLEFQMANESGSFRFVRPTPIQPSRWERLKAHWKWIGEDDGV